MWFFSEALFNYLRERSIGKKLVDLLFVCTLFTWIAAIYVVASNFDSFKQVFISQRVDIKALVVLDKAINDELRHLMTALNSDRAALARFHDTIKDVQGRHFLYETRTNETVQPGVATATGLRQNLLLSMIAPWAQEFIQNKCVYMTNLKPSDLFYEFFIQIGVKSDIKCPVWNTDHSLVGFVYAEFTTRTLSLDELHKIEPQIRNFADKIGVLLSLDGVQ